MTDLNVHQIPNYLYERLRRYALESNLSVNDAVLNAIECELEWRQRLAKRPETDLGVAAVELLVEERALRDAELEKRVSFLDC